MCYVDIADGEAPRKGGALRRREANTTAKRKTTTSTEVKARWNDKTYKAYRVYLRKDDDAELITFVEENKEAHGTTELFRAGLEKLKNEGL